MNYFYVAVIIAIFAGAAFVISDSKTNKKQEQVVTPAASLERETPETPVVADEEITTDDESADDSTPADVTADAVTPAATPEAETPEAAIRVITMTGSNYAFSEETITVNQGDTVTINFSSTEGFHDWVVDGYGATDKVRPGTPTSVTFVADKAGSFEYYCSVGSHRAQGMVGTLVVR